MKNLFLHLLIFIIIITLSNCKKVPDTSPRYEKDTCPLCNRYGHSDEAGKCFYCKGSSICQHCNGTGKVKIGDPDNYYETTCPFCKGTGKCSYCDGKGKCKRCDGTGKFIKLDIDKNDSIKISEDNENKVKE